MPAMPTWNGQMHSPISSKMTCAVIKAMIIIGTFASPLARKIELVTQSTVKGICASRSNFR